MWIKLLLILCKMVFILDFFMQTFPDFLELKLSEIFGEVQDL